MLGVKKTHVKTVRSVAQNVYLQSILIL